MIYASLQFEQSYWVKGYQYICGVDEVGRGCFAGPVVVGAVIFPKDFQGIEGLADSKLLTPEKREKLSVQIKEQALCWSVAEIGVGVINQIGIGKATQQAFATVVQQLSQEPDFILIDAFYIQTMAKEKQLPIKKGDQLSASIAAASIIAKVDRDALMQELDKQYPQYGFAMHKGYGTKHHQQMLKEHGLSQEHRTSFHLEKFLI